MWWPLCECPRKSSELMAVHAHQQSRGSCAHPVAREHCERCEVVPVPVTSASASPIYGRLVQL
eukprot:5881663-Pleurochrysis_carterae.AAC.7